MKKHTIQKILPWLAPFIGLILIELLFAILTKGVSVQMRNLKTVVDQSFILIIISTGVFFVMTLGMMDLSVGGIVCLCCYVYAKVCQVNIFLGIIAGLCTGVLIGGFNGFVVTKLKAQSFLATLCTSYIISGLMVQLISSQAVTVPFALYVCDEFIYKLILLVVIFAVCYMLYRHTKFGHYVRMIGVQELAATFTGIKVGEVKMLAYLLCGFLAAIVAFLTAIRGGTVAVTTGSDLMFNSMIALTLGGFPMGGGAKAKISAPVIGGLMLSALNNGLVIMGVTSQTQQVIKGAIFIVIVVIAAEGEKLKGILGNKKAALTAQ